jgi:hypothetical protein
LILHFVNNIKGYIYIYLSRPGMVVYIYNPSSSGSRDMRVMVSGQLGKS